MSRIEAGEVERRNAEEEREKLVQLSRFCHALCPQQKAMPELSQPPEGRRWLEELERYFGVKTVIRAAGFVRWR